MTLHIVHAVRKPFNVDAVQVTAENMEEVARWCRGKVKTEQSSTSATPQAPTRYIHVRVLHPLNPKQTQAYIGDWVLVTDTGSKVYSDKAYHNNFDEVEDSPIEEPVTEPVAHNVFENAAEA